MEEPKQGFFFRGADNKGECISITLAEDQTFEDYISKYVPDYTEDPQFTFEDSIIYGCHMDMDYLQLKDFCKNKRFQNLLLF